MKLRYTEGSVVQNVILSANNEGVKFSFVPPRLVRAPHMLATNSLVCITIKMLSMRGITRQLHFASSEQKVCTVLPLQMGKSWFSLKGCSPLHVKHHKFLSNSIYSERCNMRKSFEVLDFLLRDCCR